MAAANLRLLAAYHRARELMGGHTFIKHLSDFGLNLSIFYINGNQWFRNGESEGVEESFEGQ